MVFWLLAGMALLLVYIYSAALIHFPSENVADRVAGNDASPARGIYAGRAERARVNMLENMPIFLGLGMLSLVLDDANHALAAQGAAVFVLARAAYLAFYIAAIPLTRSLSYGVSLIGLGMMAWALL